MSVQRITSRQNPLMQHLHKLQSAKSYRARCGEFVGDGVKLLEEAVRWGMPLRTVVAVDGVELCPLPPEARVVRIPEGLMAHVSLMEAPQGVLFTCAMPEPTPLSPEGGCVVLDGIQDPGNLGTMLRTADALEIPLVLTEGCADPYNPKVVRAAMGALFRAAPRLSTRREVADLCHEKGIPLLAAALHENARDIRELDLSRAAVVIGSEGRGVCREFLELSQQCVIIPMNSRCESLNAAVAAAIVMWQMKQSGGGTAVQTEK